MPPSIAHVPSREDAASPSYAALDAAIDWMVALRSGEMSEREKKQFEAWKKAHPQHAQAWQQVAGALERSFAPLREPRQGAVATQAILRAPHAGRRKIVRGMLLFGVLGGAGAVALRDGSLVAAAADLHTGTGERRRFDLPDGSSLLLNACSAVDVRFDATQRALYLRKGECIATTVADAARPFVIHTACGSVRTSATHAQAARFLLRQEAERSFVLALAQTVEVTSQGGETRLLQAGEALWFDRRQFGPLQQDMADRAGWEHGMLVAHDLPLADVIAAVRPYRTGFIRISPQAARLRVLGGFPLDDTDRLLESLVQTLPIRITYYSRWLALIDTA